MIDIFPSGPSALQEADCFMHLPCVFQLPFSFSISVPITPFFDEGHFLLLTSQGPLSTTFPLVSGESFSLPSAGDSALFVLTATNKTRVNLILEPSDGSEPLQLAFSPRRVFVAKKNKKNPRVIDVECLGDLPVPVRLSSGLSLGEKVPTVLQAKGETARVLVEQGQTTVRVQLLYPQLQSKFPVLQGEVPIDTESPLDRFVVNQMKDERITISAHSTPEIEVGGLGELVYELNVQASEIPLKAAFRLTNLRREAYLLEGQIAGMRTFLPGISRLEFKFVPLSAGFMNLPGLEVEALPTGGRVLLEQGPRYFAVPVVGSAVVRE